MADLVISVALVVAVVLVSEATRRTTARLFSGRAYGIYLVETVSTFQLCASTHELKLLGETGRIEPQTGLTLTFVITVIHILTFRGAFCNPTGVLEHVYRRNIPWKGAAGLIACQFVGATVAQVLAPNVWALGLSDLHLRHQRFGYKCFSPITGTLVEAAAVESAGAFAVQAAVLHIHKVVEAFRAPAIAAVITFLVFAGGSVSGAVYNPVLAFSVQFHCSGHTFLEYCFVYWLGPAIGIAGCILLFQKVIPFLSGKTTIGLDFRVTQKKLQ